MKFNQKTIVLRYVSKVAGTTSKNGRHNIHPVKFDRKSYSRLQLQLHQPKALIKVLCLEIHQKGRDLGVQETIAIREITAVPHVDSTVEASYCCAELG